MCVREQENNKEIVDHLFLDILGHFFLNCHRTKNLVGSFWLAFLLFDVVMRREFFVVVKKDADLSVQTAVLVC